MESKNQRPISIPDWEQPSAVSQRSLDALVELRKLLTCRAVPCSVKKPVMEVLEKDPALKDKVIGDTDNDVN